MPEYLAPGVYVEETSYRSKSIEGVSTTTTGFVGAARYGPVDLVPDVLTSLSDFERCHGGGERLAFGKAETMHNYLWHAVRAFFEEGGKRLYVARAFRAGGEKPYGRPASNVKDDIVSIVDGRYPDGHARLWVTEADDKSKALLLRARFPGAMGNFKILVTAQMGQNVLTAKAGETGKSEVKGLQPGDLVWIGPKDAGSETKGKLYLSNLKADGSDWYFSEDNTVANAKHCLNDSQIAGAPPLEPETEAVRVITACLEVAGTGAPWPGMAFQPGHRSINGMADAVIDRFRFNPASAQDARTLPIEILVGEGLTDGRKVFEALIERSVSGDFAAADFPIRSIHNLMGGNDGKRPGADEYAGVGDAPDSPKTGLKAFEDIDDISIVAAPGATCGYENGFGGEARQIIAKLIAHAENMRYRVAVLDCGDDQNIQEVRSMRARIDSKHAALYYPWIRVLDPVTREEIALPPSGFVAGIYARNDIERGVYKAPANEVVRGALDFERVLNKAQQDVLNPEGINCFRFFEGRGNRLWGARTISSDPEWKYLNVRRYFAYLEHSIDRGTQWAVFEPNGERLWANVRETISDFLSNEWRNGALLGATPDKAYFVRCDRSTMTQNDLDNGRLVCQIGVAAIKPAEYVIFRIGQWTADRKN